jgi:hypothetical protein
VRPIVFSIVGVGVVASYLVLRAFHQPTLAPVPAAHAIAPAPAKVVSAAALDAAALEPKRVRIIEMTGRVASVPVSALAVPSPIIAAPRSPPTVIAAAPPPAAASEDAAAPVQMVQPTRSIGPLTSAMDIPAAPRGEDICSRHHMHKVWYGRHGWPSWRCVR